MTKSKVDLNATQEIIAMIEHSRSKRDNILDYLPGVFALLDNSGRILTGNKNLATIMGCKKEDLLNRSIYKMFGFKGVNGFKNQLTRVMAERETLVEFFFSGEAVCSNYLWNAEAISLDDDKEDPIIRLVGMPVDYLFKKELVLSSIFANLPLTIIIVNAQRKIDSVYSGQQDWLLGHDYEKADFREVLFPSGRRKGKTDEAEAVSKLGDCFGQKVDFFDSLRGDLPEQVTVGVHKMDGTENQMRIGYQPLVMDGRVEKIFFSLTAI